MKLQLFSIDLIDLKCHIYENTSISNGDSDCLIEYIKKCVHVPSDEYHRGYMNGMDDVNNEIDDLLDKNEAIYKNVE